MSISSSSAGVNNSTVFTYNYGLLTSLSHQGMKIDYTCDGRGRKTDIKLNGNDFVWNTYNDNYKNEELGIYHGKLTTATTSDGYYVDLIIDEKGKVRRTSFDSAQYYGDSVYEYDCENLVKVISNKTNRDSQDTFTEVLETSYDDYNNVTDFTKTVNDDAHFYRAFTYDSKNRLSKEEISIQDGDVLQTEYQYDEDNRITKLDIKGLFTINYDYDVLNRVKHQNIEIDKSSSYSSQKIELCHEYSYLQQDENSLDLVAEDRTKVIVRKESISEENKLIPIKIYMTETSKYNYDESGNIIEIDADDSLTRYQYDKLNRLVREDNPKLNKTITYKYDSAGNILLKKTYEYTLEDKLYSPKVDEYTYECDGWNDQLLFFNGKQFEYDKMGRPITYMDNLLEWESNGNLLSFMSEEVEAYYSYDANGIRRNKIVNDVETSFIVDGTRILRAITKNGILTYKYALNKLIGFNYNDGSNSKEYIYLRNIQGDIIAIYDDEGNEVGGYAYDAYGNHIITNDVDGIATLNPFRYRGYYYDEETGLYYLNSRYYDPKTGRFISPDIISILDETMVQINGLNLYMYCGDNPVMNVDPSGRFFFSFLAAILIAAVAGGAIGGVAAAVNGQDFWSGALAGMAAGALVGLGIGIGIAVIEGMSVLLGLGIIGTSLYAVGSNIAKVIHSYNIVAQYDDLDYFDIIINLKNPRSIDTKILTDDETIMKYVNFLYEKVKGVKENWTKEQLYRELKYHSLGSGNNFINLIFESHLRTADVEETQTFRSYFLRFFGNMLW